MEGDLQKQRRNLLVVSVLLIIQAIAEVDISKVSLLGTELKTEKVGVLLACFWVLWIYFLLRYYQYWREGNLAEKFWDRVDTRKAILLQEWAQTYANDWFGSRKNGRWLLHQGYDGYLEIHLQRSKEYEDDTADFEVKRVPSKIHVLTKARAAIWVTLQTPETTEHVLPFALALAAPIALLAMNWGSLMHGLL